MDRVEAARDSNGLAVGVRGLSGVGLSLGSGPRLSVFSVRTSPGARVQHDYTVPSA